MNAQQTMPSNDLAELLALQDYYFVRGAYQTVLGREADEGGLNHFTGRLRNGEPKIQILMELHFSAEGRTHSLNMPTLNQEMRRYKLTHIPFLGRLFGLFIQTESNGLHERRLRVIEQQLFAHSDMTFHRINQLEAALLKLPQLNGQLVLQSETNTLHPQEFSMPTRESIPVAAVEPPKHLAPQAREIFFQLKTAMNKRVGRVA